MGRESTEIKNVKPTDTSQTFRRIYQALHTGLVVCITKSSKMGLIVKVIIGFLVVAVLVDVTFGLRENQWREARQRDLFFRNTRLVDEGSRSLSREKRDVGSDGVWPSYLNIGGGKVWAIDQNTCSKQGGKSCAEKCKQHHMGYCHGSCGGTTGNICYCIKENQGCPPESQACKRACWK